jgi:hypothetical protein
VHFIVLVSIIREMGSLLLVCVVVTVLFCDRPSQGREEKGRADQLSMLHILIMEAQLDCSEEFYPYIPLFLRYS